MAAGFTFPQQTTCTDLFPTLHAHSIRSCFLPSKSCYHSALSMGSRNPSREATAADEVGTEHPDTEESGEENSLSQPWMRMGPKLGPLCALCKTRLANQLHSDFGKVCSRCAGDIDKDLKEWYWLMLTRPDGTLVSHEIRRRVASYIWGKEAQFSCYCGLCQDKGQAERRRCSGTQATNQAQCKG